MLERLNNLSAAIRICPICLHFAMDLVLAKKALYEAHSNLSSCELLLSGSTRSPRSRNVKRNILFRRNQGFDCSLGVKVITTK